MKKIYIVLGIVLLIIIIIFLGWYLLARNPETPLGETVGNILPFGSGDNTNIPISLTDDKFGNDTLNNSDQTFDEFGSPAANLFRISDTPIAGAVIFKRNGATIVRYVDRATGHIYDADLATLAKTKIANQTLPKIYEAHFRPDGNAVLVRSLKDDSDVVENLVLTLTPPKSTSTDTLYSVSSAPVRGNINTIAVGSGNTLFYSLRDTSSIVSATFSGAGDKTLLTSPFTDWRLAAAGNSLIVYTKAGVNASGFAYKLGTPNGVLTKILGPLNGLVVIPNVSGNRVLYSYVENNETRLFAKNLTNNALSEILPTTIAEKCIWSIKQIDTVFCGAPIDGLGPNEQDDWYRGATHFSDSIWLFNTGAEFAQVLSEPKTEFGVDLDLAEPKLSPDEDYLIFTNNTDLSLWALKLDRP